jgi:hypothetical protein
MTDVQWGIVGTTSVAITTVIIRLISTGRERRFQRAVQLSDRREADKSRRRDERKAVYSDLLVYLHERLIALTAVERISDLTSFQGDQAVALRARVGTIASEPVRSGFDTFLETLARIDDMAKNSAIGYSSGESWAAFADLRNRLKTTTAALEEKVGRELDEI